MRSSKRAARRAGIVKTDGVAKPHNCRSELAREALDRDERVNLNTAIREQARSYIQSIGRLKPAGRARRRLRCGGLHPPYDCARRRLCWVENGAAFSTAAGTE